MNRTAIVSALVAGSALVGASYLFKSRRPGPRALASGIIPIITPVIDLRVAEDVLEAMERVPGDAVTVVLHTLGGCVTSCVLIANALREFPQSTAIVPYMATSGGTLIALNARQLQMGRSAALSAVDPIVHGLRAKHLPENPTGPHACDGAGVRGRDHPLHARYARGASARRRRASPVGRRVGVHGGEHAARVADPARRGRRARAPGEPVGPVVDRDGGHVSKAVVVTMATTAERIVAAVVREEKPRVEQPRVEVVEGALCSEEELRRAVVTTAVTSGILCALAGVGLGYLLGLREGRE
jgi:hypothetical protein